MQNCWKTKLATGKCWNCNEPAQEGRRRCSKHLKVESDRQRAHPRELKAGWERSQRLNLTEQIQAAYGNKCACPPCGETNWLFLTLDHKGGGGSIDRKKFNRSNIKIYRMVRDLGFPPTFQLLCWDCNCGRARNKGICPHIAEETLLNELKSGLFVS